MTQKQYLVVWLNESHEGWSKGGFTVLADNDEQAMELGLRGVEAADKMGGLARVSLSGIYNLTDNVPVTGI